MKEFINREKERAFLESEYNKESASFIVIYGRRRIGKTSLIKEFIKDKSALFFLATEESESENRNAFKTAVSEYINNPLLAQADIPNWEELFSYIVNDASHDRKLIIIDEFQYIGKANRAFVSVLQKIWDTMLSDKNIMLILCGSLVNMMYSQTLSYDSPLYGRRTGQIKMKQIAFRCYRDFFPTAAQRQLIENYAVTGGVPKYIESFELYDNVYTAIERCVMSKESYLYEEPAFLLEKEVQDVGSYFSIIKTIASGKEKQSEIASALNVAQTNLPKYLKTLIDLDILEREVPATEDKPEKSKMGLYKIKDNYIRFWFRFIYPYRSYIEMDNTDFVMQKIKAGFVTNHAAFVYEDICRREYMPDLVANGSWSFTPTRIGRWWDRSDTEIDIVAIDESSDNVIFGECKFTNEPMDVDVYYQLLEKIERVEWKKKTRKNHFVFFSFNGYTDKLRQLAEEKGDILLYE
nr:ATP-binding protein [uncultured Ruminococcus sp.]